MTLRRLLPCLAAALLAASPAPAGWSGFYAAARPSAAAVTEDAACVKEILAAQERHGIPENLLLGIGLQEAGMARGGRLTVWPWAANAAGEGRIFDTREDAMAWVRERQRDGMESIDVGCLQINLRWHPKAFADLNAAFDPARNAEYAARFLKRLHARTGDWRDAAGAYHSFTPEKRGIYLASLDRNIAVANDRIASFRAQAARAQTDTPAPDRAQPSTGAIWASGLSGGEGARRSIYSSTDLQPVLPAFLRAPPPQERKQ
ncbi:transglycosylase SLT domain-containing protein [Tranquillimonas alkanivorans]|uniref:Transglycosylase SLT domain-containing protein n=1 Tax=Tranquillimonas alkanivorans TaxID=441119 RepID=A0A1I5S3B1_9RHOB|nr:Transglycosylase SLT domain-containing protein [Tranquillimonas alkanivorans]